MSYHTSDAVYCACGRLCSCRASKRLGVCGVCDGMFEYDLPTRRLLEGLGD